MPEPKPWSLAERIRDLLCPIATIDRAVLEPRCKCADPWPIRYGCAYGDCEIVRCNRCHKIMYYSRRECNFPYSRR